ncbi:MAG: 2-C-methyl-D-erythritol 4-phosphate cytidylyltransferase [Clostridiales bacterium]|nr:2-C-methyl-D-erythritol 4-phosphate cytidylyltransferase [Clostridiales bacterium]
MNIRKLMKSKVKSDSFVNKHHFTSCVVPVAGKSTRTSGDTRKQFVEVNGIPVIIRTLISVNKCELIDEIIIVCSKNDFEYYEKAKTNYSLSKISKIVEGGETRFDSVKNGFDSISEKAEYVAIQDGARCLTKISDYRRVIKAAYKYDAAIAVQNSTDTLKSIDKNGQIESTLDRNVVVRAQTPQVFEKTLYTVAVYNPNLNRDSITDDSFLVESLGRKVEAVDCGSYNMKITTDLDFKLAEKIIESGVLDED